VKHFAEVDVIEPVRHYLDAATSALSGEDAQHNCALRFLCEPLQSWTPAHGRFDVIWVQWCLGHLTDGACV
jgi:protein N-terminal methyltransferase